MKNKIALLLSIMATSALVTACDDAAPMKDVGALREPSGQSQDLTSDWIRVYSVPVSAELEPWATFPMPRTEVKREIRRNGREWLKLDYDLPPELVSEKHFPIVLKGESFPDGSMELSGRHGEARCEGRDEKLVCTIQYRDLNIDPAATENYIRSRYQDPVEVSRRLQVARRFRDDPIGIVHSIPAK